MKKITMMDNLTLYINKNEYRIEIDEKFTNVSSLEEIEDLEHSLTGFFDLESFTRNNNKIYLIYDIPEGYQPLSTAKNNIPVIKLQLIKNLLEKDPLLNSDGKTYLDLNNIFYKDFKDIKVLYRSNGLLPFHKGIDPLEQYKVFVLGFFSDKYSYKRFLVNKDNILKKENKDFMFSVNAAVSFADLKTLVDRELEKEQSKFYEMAQLSATSKKKGFKRKLLVGSLSFLLMTLLFAGGMKQVEKNVTAEFVEEIAAAEKENELTLAVASGDTNTAIEILEDREASSGEIANMLIEAGRYNEAIQYEESVEKDVVNRLYELDLREKILELESDSEFMQTEKEIVKFDEESLIQKASFITEKETLLRLGLTFLEHEKFQESKGVFERLVSGDSESFSLNENEQKKVEQYINKTDLEIEIQVLNEKILALQNYTSFEDTEESKQEREEEIKSLKDELTDVQKELIKADENLGMDDA